MAKVTLTISDRDDGGLEVTFEGDDLKTATTMKKNTCAQNAAISLAFWMDENGLGDNAPDLTSEQGLRTWLEKKSTSTAKA